MISYEFTIIRKNVLSLFSIFLLKFGLSIPDITTIREN